MPIYSLRNTKTNELTEESMSYENLQKYLAENPHIKQEIFHSPPTQGDSFRLGIRKPDEGFKDILRNIKHTHKSTITNLGSKHI